MFRPKFLPAMKKNAGRLVSGAEPSQCCLPNLRIPTKRRWKSHCSSPGWQKMHGNHGIYFTYYIVCQYTNDSFALTVLTHLTVLEYVLYIYNGLDDCKRLHLCLSPLWSCLTLSPQFLNIARDVAIICMNSSRNWRARVPDRIDI